MHHLFSVPLMVVRDAVNASALAEVHSIVAAKNDELIVNRTSHESNNAFFDVQQQWEQEWRAAYDLCVRDLNVILTAKA